MLYRTFYSQPYSPPHNQPRSRLYRHLQDRHATAYQALRYRFYPFLMLSVGLLAGFVSSGAWAQIPGDDAIEPNVVAAPPVVNDEGEVVAYTDYHDPLMPFNRAMFRFNDVTYRYVLIPVARGYQNVVPQPARTGISNFFHNLRTPIYMINHLFQGRPGDSGRDLGRFLINSTVGIVGLFDPADHWFDMERQVTSASQTLTRHGVNHGPYLVLPFFGASNVRDGTGLFLDYWLHPVQYVMDNPEAMGVRAIDNFQEYAPAAESYLDIHDESQDPYIFMRNLHLQGLQRDARYPSPEQ